ncbi:MAG: type II toxin-antitoxin system PemK/MazF family toxin [Acidobacteria bacterium]|nr:MAG: type II toxin-antitoxin system PemK/MazF family toxin [Acidobacteriota bacterium]RLE35926.1 MAG: type II toxin-antitoxin system PemK/MazF family toxin [Acidobacteriota bacterium]
MSVSRYDIFLANLDPTIGSEINKTRPVVVISDDLLNQHLKTVVACPLTTSLHPSWRSRIQTLCAGQEAEIAVDQIRAISKLRLIKRLDRLSAATAAELRRVITEMYGG